MNNPTYDRANHGSTLTRTAPKPAFYNYKYFCLDCFPSCCGATILHNFVHVPPWVNVNKEIEQNNIKATDKDLHQLFSTGKFQANGSAPFICTTSLTIAILSPSQFYLQPLLEKYRFKVVSEFLNPRSHNTLRTLHRIV